MPHRLSAAALTLCLVPLASRAQDDNPFKNAKVGDYATYKLETKLPSFSFGGTLTQTVTAKNDKEATVKMTGTVNVGDMKKDVPVSEQRIDLTKPYDPTKLNAPGGVPAGIGAKIEKDKEGKEKLKVAGKEYDCTWTTYKLKARPKDIDIEAELKVWMAKDIPLGLARMEMKAEISAQGGKQAMNMTLELTETGNKKP
jgi:hypothetical protein